MFEILILGRTEENANKQLEDYLSKQGYFDFKTNKRYKYKPNTLLLENGALITAIMLKETHKSILADFIMMDSTIDMSKYWMPYVDYFTRYSPLPRENRVVYFSPYE